MHRTRMPYLPRRHEASSIADIVHFVKCSPGRSATTRCGSLRPVAATAALPGLGRGRRAVRRKSGRRCRATVGSGKEAQSPGGPKSACAQFNRGLSTSPWVTRPVHPGSRRTHPMPGTGMTVERSGPAVHTNHGRRRWCSVRCSVARQRLPMASSCPISYSAPWGTRHIAVQTCPGVRSARPCK